MPKTVAQLTPEELREWIEVVIEQKLLELIGDPDEGQDVKQSVRGRLLRQQRRVAAGQPGWPFDQVSTPLGLE